MGGLIIRAALPSLQEYRSKFFTYLTMGSPHIGYMYNSNKLVDTGMWALKFWKNSLALTQLQMSDQAKPEETCLYKLSVLPGLAWFKNVVLCSSF